MKQNIGKTDKIVRMILGISIISLGFIFNNRLGLCGLAPIISASLGYCPLYRLLHVSTCKKKLLSSFAVYPE